MTFPTLRGEEMLIVFTSANVMIKIQIAFDVLFSYLHVLCVHLQCLNNIE